MAGLETFASEAVTTSCNLIGVVREVIIRRKRIVAIVVSRSVRSEVKLLLNCKLCQTL
jgi:hypothetical protein